MSSKKRLLTLHRVFHGARHGFHVPVDLVLRDLLVGEAPRRDDVVERARDRGVERGVASLRAVIGDVVLLHQDAHDTDDPG